MNSNEEVKRILEEFIQRLTSLLSEVEELNTGSSVPKLVDTEEEGRLSKQSLLELVYHEGIVLEAYKDSKGVWTWGVGVTNPSGHRVYPRYKDNPQTLTKVMEVFDWLVREKYLPDVLEAFKGFELNEHELAAALSFHYNTGGIKRASWVRSYKAGKIAQAKREFMNWRSPKEIISRRKAERDLFFDGRWSNDGTSTVFKIRKPSYTPNWSSAKKVDISKELK